MTKQPDQASDKADPTSSAINKALTAYETFEPASKVFGHIEAYVKSGKPKK